ncbi:transglycosylase domain-containing protein, partial [Patescibacteria group bacterium]|nr:transglycosylase domain-containing protein [Patescibacteria group bacterium]
MFKKDDILKMYLNEIPYGSNAYGVKVAAKTYFDKELEEITLEEAAILAALPQAPTYLSPYGDNKESLLARKDLILQLMAEQGYIDQEEADKAKKKEIAFASNPYGSIEAPHFVMYVRQKLVEKYGEKMANEGGLKVYTTLDKDLYDIANKAVKEIGARNAKNYRASNASLVSIDPKTGQILAMVGSRDFFDEDIDGSVNVAIRDRQPGSSFKPFAYATLFKKENWGPGSTLYDVQTDFGGGYIPKNYDGSFRGATTVRRALQGSLNIPAVKALYIGGMNETLKTAHDMGITTLNDPGRYGLSLVLGSGEVKPIDMAAAFGVFGNNGIKHDLSWYVKIEDSSGKVLDKYEDRQGKQVLDPQISYLMSDMLSDNNSRAYVFGSNSPLNVPGYKVAAKTGTTNDNKDAWTVGYTPSISTAVWAGNNDGSKMTNAGGVTAAGPIWNAYMKEALKKFPKENFKKPSGIKNVSLDAITGRQITDSTKNKSYDMFPSWYKVPLADGKSVEVKVDKSTGKLATDKCPPELIETRIYSPIQAEITSNDPSFGRWNPPVLAWAQRAGYNTSTGSIPTEPCDVHTGEDLPTIEFEAPTDGQEIGSNFTVVLSVGTPKGFGSISLTADGKTYTPIANGAYYESAVTFTTPGEKTIKVTVKDKASQTTTKSIKVIVTVTEP